MSVITPELVLVGIGVLLFFAGREIALWYFRLNDIVKHLKSIDESLQQMPAVREHRRRLGL